MATSSKHQVWQVSEREGHVRLKTGRIGLLGSIDASAPIAGGQATWAADKVSLVLKLAINEVKAGNALLDSAARRLVSSGSDGILTFEGDGAATGGAVTLDGQAWAGDVKVAMVVKCDAPVDVNDEQRELQISGTATFDDVKIPLPGFGKVNSIDIEVVGMLSLSR
ncbi:MAG: hypothetical protein WC054_12855 [Candidatus Nanopelagicales bacterium]